MKGQYIVGVVEVLKANTNTLDHIPMYFALYK